MRQPAQVQIRPVHASPVVNDPYPLNASRLQINLDISGAGVYGVVQQLPDNRMRSVDDLSCGNLACNIIPEDLDPPG